MKNDCLKVTTYFGERQRTDDQFVADALLDLYGRTEIEGVMLRGAEGFGLKHHLRTDRLFRKTFPSSRSPSTHEPGSRTCLTRSLT